MSVFAQIIVQKSPGTDFYSKQDNIPVFTFPEVDHKAMLLEDELEMQYKDVALRIAKPFYVTIDLIQEGFYYLDEKGMKNYIIELDVPGANAVGLILSKFRIPDNAELYVYNEDQSSVNGAITSINNNIKNRMQVSPVRGDVIYVLYKEPLNANFKGNIEIEIVTHVYRDLYKSEKDFGDSGSCNINVVCDDGLGWEDEARSVAMMINGSGSRVCTGALVNNTSLDGTPYFLSAEHCLPSDLTELGVWSFIFNYKSDDCDPSVNGLLGNSVFGSELKASNTNNDFALLELDNAPPASYNVYYAGWTRSSIISPTSTKCIHHPHGDVMKISSDDDPPELSGYLTTGVDYWKVVDWDAGTTEGGSSGSPLFNQVGKIIGQLRGGQASCTNDLPDYYGAFYKSWDVGAAADERLKDWLDEGDLDVTSLNGIDLNDLGVQEVERDYKFTIYPNPAKNQINLRVEEEIFIEEIQIIDISGRTLKIQDVRHMVYDKYSIDIQGFPNGVYQMRIFSSGNVSTAIFLVN